MLRPEDLITVSITTTPDKLASVYALLGGAAVAAIATGAVRGSTAAESATGSTSAPAVIAPNAASDAETAPAGGTAAPASDDGVLDAGGWPWSADLHASTKGTTKEGFWRMKVGVSRPDPKPGFPKVEGSAAPAGGTGTTDNSAASNAGASAGTTPAASTADDDDEFAQFRAAADKANATDATAAGSIPPRKWTDADLGALCNQAAVKLGDPAPVKELIAQFTPAGQVPHSRNIAEDQREPFAKAVEAKAGIEFAG